MVVVSQELIDRLQTNAEDKKPNNPYRGNSLDEEMQQILNSKNMDDSEKWKLYKQALHRFLHIAENKRQPINIPIVELGGNVHERRMDEAVAGVGPVEGGPMEEIVDSFSKTYRSDARNILRFMKRGGSLISWDGDYTVYVSGKKIPDSNIVDILNGIVKIRMRDYTPPGWHEVLNALKAMNVPKEYINNSKALKEINAEYRHSFTDADEDDEDDLGAASPVRTPLGQRLRSSKQSLLPSPVKATKRFTSKTPLSNLDKWEQFPR